MPLISIPETLRNLIFIEIEECPFDLLDLAIKRAVIDFCELSQYWQEDVGPILVESGVSEYEIPITSSQNICSIMRVFYSENDCKVPLGRLQEGCIPVSYWQSSPTTLCIDDNQNLNGKELSVIASLAPKLDSNDFKFSDRITIDYQEAILAKAKAYLYAIPRKPWTDLNQAQINESMFMKKYHEALLHQARGFSRVPDQSVKKPRLYY